MLAGYGAAHAEGIAELLDTEVRVHVAGLHDGHDALHEGLGAAEHLLLVGLDALRDAHLVALLVVEDVLDAILQLGGVVALFEHAADGVEQLLGLTALETGHPPVVEIDEEGDEDDAQQQAEPPAVVEGGTDDDVDGGDGGLLDGRRGVAHLEGVVAGGKGAVAHGVLAELQGDPLAVDAFHAVAEHGLALVAVVEGGEGDGEGAVALAQTDGAGDGNILGEVLAARGDLLVVDHELGEDDLDVGRGGGVLTEHLNEPALAAEIDDARGVGNGGVPIEVLVDEALAGEEVGEGAGLGVVD